MGLIGGMARTAVVAGTATAVCRLVNAGRTTITVQTEVRNDDGKLLTMTTQTQAVLLPR